jgi:hypothetical protein
MTTPAERTRAVIETERAVSMLLNFTVGKADNALVPRDLLRKILLLQRHYPLPLEIAMTHDKCPELWGKP